MTNKRITSALIITVVTAILVMGAWSGLDAARPHQQNIVGSWDVTVYFSEPPGRDPLEALYTFNLGGTLLQTANNDPRTIAPGHGSWIRKGDREFAATLIRFLFDEQGRHTRTFKARITVTVDEESDTFEGAYDSDFYAPDGTLIGPAFAGTLSGTRIPVEPLE